MRSMVRAYSQQGHGPRADHKGRIHISDFRTPARPHLRNAAGPYIWVDCVEKLGGHFSLAIFHQAEPRWSSDGSNNVTSLNHCCAKSTPDWSWGVFQHNRSEANARMVQQPLDVSGCYGWISGVQIPAEPPVCNCTSLAPCTNIRRCTKATMATLLWECARML